MPETAGLAGRRALVTGAGTGIGLAVALALAEAGARVVLHYHRHREEAMATAAALQGLGHDASAVHADLADHAAAVGLVDETVARLGGLDILVNNAGVTRVHPIDDESGAMFDGIVAINLRAPYFITQRALPYLAESGQGSIVFLTSILGATGYAGHALYGATKGALASMTRHLAIELAPRRIRVNAVSPGPIEVPRYVDDPGYSRELGDSLAPIGRVGVPDDVAGGVVYLVSDAASFVTGTVLWIDGGVSARMASYAPGRFPNARSTDQAAVAREDEVDR
jgi:NAD(P)-dependent dehydrogenase (short-subunit alcohol dehydrogenase family)